jgi:two-component system capsular synthesis sensor histidine kinase RcsC
MHATAQPDAVQDQEGWIELSAAMRELMAKTLMADIGQIEQGLLELDAIAVRHRLHSLSGALASVHAQRLYLLSQQLEEALHAGPLSEPLVQQIRALCARLTAVSKCLSEQG